MAKITPESIADLKALFQDNEKALGANFSQLIDFFNNNKVTDNGDGTFTVGTIMVDASKLYDLINNSSPNILPLDNEFTGKNTFDIAPINKANGKPYITADSVPPVDLSNYPTKDQLATKADTSAIDPSVMVKRTLTANDDILALDPGTYWVWGANKTPKNFPTSVVPWGRVVVKMMSPDGLPNGTNVDNKIVEVFDTVGKHFVNIRQGNPVKWSGWQVPNSGTMATKSDVTTAVSTATANMVDSSKPTNFTAGLQSGGVNVATAADLKSIEDSAWRELDLSGTSGLYKGKINIKIDDANKTIYLQGAMYFPGGTSPIPSQGTALIDLSKVISSVTSSHGYLFFITGNNEHATQISSNDTVSTLGFSNSSITINSYVDYSWGNANYILPFPDAGKSSIYVTYDKLV